MAHRYIETRVNFKGKHCIMHIDLKEIKKRKKIIRFLPFELAILSWNRKKLDFLEIFVFLGFLCFLGFLALK